eukprot:GHVR01143276.1.p1 GENE.GHVR01143276.1~~GHVR01143276.1.p1  ORF type:complete len:1456 (-),score=405.39 GHVR01143276.1:176-3973(-)
MATSDILFDIVEVEAQIVAAASMFICIQGPSLPEYRMDNETGEPLWFIQSLQPHPELLQPFEQQHFAWHMPGGSRTLQFWFPPVSEGKAAFLSAPVKLKEPMTTAEAVRVTRGRTLYLVVIVEDGMRVVKISFNKLRYEYLKRDMLSGEGLEAERKINQSAFRKRKEKKMDLMWCEELVSLEGRMSASSTDDGEYFTDHFGNEVIKYQPVPLDAQQKWSKKDGLIVQAAVCKDWIDLLPYCSAMRTADPDRLAHLKKFYRKKRKHKHRRKKNRNKKMHINIGNYNDEILNSAPIIQLRKLKNSGVFTVRRQRKRFVSLYNSVAVRTRAPTSPVGSPTYLGRDSIALQPHEAALFLLFPFGFEVKAHIEGIGISLTDSSPSELLYAGILGIHIGLTSNGPNSDIQTGIRIEDIKIDDRTTQGSHFANILSRLNVDDEIAEGKRGFHDNSSILLTDVNTKKSLTQPGLSSCEAAFLRPDKLAPVLQLRFDLTPWVALGQGVLMFRQWVVALQPIALKVDQDSIGVVLLAVIELINKADLSILNSTSSHKIRLSEQNRNSSEFRSQIDPPDYISSGSHSKTVYVEFIRVLPLRIHISFRASRLTKHTRKQSKLGGSVKSGSTKDVPATVALMKAVDVVTEGQLPDLTDARIVIKGVQRTHQYTAMSLLVKSIGRDYLFILLKKLVNVLASADLLGNPWGLLERLLHGCIEAVRQPFEGLLRGPDGFVIGLFAGIKALLSNVILGVLDSVASVAGGFAKLFVGVGQNAEVLDRILSSRYKYNHNKVERPRHIIEGALAGGLGALQLICAGIAGVVIRPLLSAIDGGTPPRIALSAVGGVAGVLTGTAGGALVLTQGLIAGIRNTFSYTSAPRRVFLRSQRAFGVDGRLEQYSAMYGHAVEVAKKALRRTFTGIAFTMAFPADLRVSNPAYVFVAASIAAKRNKRTRKFKPQNKIEGVHDGGGKVEGSNDKKDDGDKNIIYNSDKNNINISKNNKKRNNINNNNTNENNMIDKKEPTLHLKPTVEVPFSLCSSWVLATSVHLMYVKHTKLVWACELSDVVSVGLFKVFADVQSFVDKFEIIVSARQVVTDDNSFFRRIGCCDVEEIIVSSEEVLPNIKPHTPTSNENQKYEEEEDVAYEEPSSSEISSEISSDHLTDYSDSNGGDNEVNSDGGNDIDELPKTDKKKNNANSINVNQKKNIKSKFRSKKSKKKQRAMLYRTGMKKHPLGGFTVQDSCRSKCDKYVHLPITLEDEELAVVLFDVLCNSVPYV